MLSGNPYTVILSDVLYNEVKLLQRKLSDKYGDNWNSADTVALLLRFYLSKESIDDSRAILLEKYLDKRKPFLEELVSRILISVY